MRLHNVSSSIRVRMNVKKMWKKLDNPKLFDIKQRFLILFTWYIEIKPDDLSQKKFLFLLYQLSLGESKYFRNSIFNSPVIKFLWKLFCSNFSHVKNHIPRAYRMSNIFLNCTFELAPLIWKILDPQNYDGVIFTFRHVVVLLFEMSRSPQMRLRYGKKNLVAVKNFLMSLALCT